MRLKSRESEATASKMSATTIGRPLLVIIKGSPMEVVETIEQFAWFASAFRSVGKNPTALSQVDFRVVSELSENRELVTELILLPLQSCVATEPSSESWWLSTMASLALASGFPIKERGQAVGLEVPCTALLKTPGERKPVEFKDSMIIRHGPLNIYPIAKHRNGVQWHAVVDGFDAFVGKLKTLPILSLEKDIRSFYHSRAFILTGNNVDSIRTFVG